jgi:putative ABC transport system substrate-binding protein
MQFDRLERREFITLLGGAAWPLAASAQTKRPLLGYLGAAALASVVRSTTNLAFVNALRDHGYVEGRDIDIAYRFAEGFFDRLPALAQELVRLKPDAILAPTPVVALAARAATATIPIVSPLLENPVRLGLIASENRPGGNVTGLLRYVDGLAGKHVELARELIPGVTSIGLLVNVTNVDAAPRRDVEAAGTALVVKIYPVEVETPNDLDGAFQRFVVEGVQTVIVLNDSMFFSERRRLLTLAAATRLPTIWTAREFAEDGGVVSYGINEADNFRRSADYVVKILKGAKPGDLPVELPIKFELMINLKTAKALGLTVPPQLLGRADEVIE